MENMGLYADSYKLQLSIISYTYLQGLRMFDRKWDTKKPNLRLKLSFYTSMRCLTAQTCHWIGACPIEVWYICVGTVKGYI